MLFTGGASSSTADSTGMSLEFLVGIGDNGETIDDVGETNDNEAARVASAFSSIVELLLQGIAFTPLGDGVISDWFSDRVFDSCKLSGCSHSGCRRASSSKSICSPSCEASSVELSVPPKKFERNDQPKNDCGVDLPDSLAEEQLDGGTLAFVSSTLFFFCLRRTVQGKLISVTGGLRSQFTGMTLRELLDARGFGPRQPDSSSLRLDFDVSSLGLDPFLYLSFISFGMKLFSCPS